MKILHIDIETFPTSAWVWMLRDVTIPVEMIQADPQVACWGAMWEGDDYVMFDSVNQSSRKQMLDGIYGLLNEADAVVGYNSDRFDIPWLRGEFARLGMAPPAPFKSIDLLKTVRSQFRFPSNKLAYVAKALDIGEKMEHEGFPLWKKCMEGKKEAWKRMEEYNIQDVLLLQRLYDRIKGYIKGHPNFSVINGELVCPNCGSTHRQSRGSYLTNAGLYQRFQCKDCGKWYRGNENLAKKEKNLAL